MDSNLAGHDSHGVIRAPQYLGQIESGLIVRGPFTNTLSVGVFSRADRAALQQERVAKLGYEVGIEEIGRSYDVFHLEGQVPAGFDPGNAPNGPCASIAQAH